MEHLLKIQRTVRRLEGEYSCPDTCCRRIFVPAHGNDLQQYCFCIDLSRRTVTTWKINMDALVAYLKKWFEQKYIIENFPLNAPLEEYLYGRLRFHTARYFDGKLYLYPINGFFFLRLDVDSDDYQILYDELDDVYCPTNSIADGVVYFTKWKLTDSFTRKTPEDNIPLTFGRYDIAAGRFQRITTVNGPDNIHDTARSPDGKCIVAVEMPRTVPVPPHDPKTGNTTDHLLKVLQGGIGSSRILRYDSASGRVEQAEADKSPSHIVFDRKSLNLAYIADSNLWSTYCFGTGRIDQYDFTHGIRRKKSYEAKDFYRIPSHDILSYQGQSLLCATVFANQVHCIDAQSMTLVKKITLSERRRVPDFSQGPYQYPDHDRTPYTLHPVDGTPYLILASLWGVWILDVDRAQVITKIPYNTEERPVSSMGHSISF